MNAMCTFVYLFVVYFSFASVISSSIHHYVNYSDIQVLMMVSETETLTSTLHHNKFTYLHYFFLQPSYIYIYIYIYNNFQLSDYFFLNMANKTLFRKYCNVSSLATNKRFTHPNPARPLHHLKPLNQDSLKRFIYMYIEKPSSQD